jgi:hypothetical protein
MADDKTFYQEVVEENPFPGEVAPIVPTTQSPAGTFTPTVAKEKSFPTRKVAVELIGSALNTRSKKILQEFEFTKSGAIQVGEYENGVSGDIRISPVGIVARNKAGLNTIAVDGETGDATFAGTIQAGTVISGLVVVGDNSIVIDGEARRQVWYDEDGIPVILIGNV